MRKPAMPKSDKTGMCLKARDWFLCAHCKRDYKPTGATGAMTCLKCRKKGLSDRKALEVAEELLTLRESRIKEPENDRYEAYEDTEFFFDFNWRRLPPELVRNRKLMKLLKTYSSLYGLTHANANMQNTIVADFSEKKVSEELSDRDKDRLIGTLLTGIQPRQVKAGIVIIQSGITQDNVAVLKEKTTNKLPDAKIRFLAINKKHAGHTLINAILFGNFQFPPDDGCC